MNTDTNTPRATHRDMYTQICRNTVIDTCTHRNRHPDIQRERERHTHTHTHSPQSVFEVRPSFYHPREPGPCSHPGRGAGGGAGLQIPSRGPTHPPAPHPQPPRPGGMLSFRRVVSHQTFLGFLRR